MIVNSLFIPGPLPGLNEILDATKRRGNKYSLKGKSWSGYADMHKHWAELTAWKAKRLPRMQSAWIVFRWKEKHTRRDPDNIAAAKKFLLDGLVMAGTLPDDGWAHVLGWNDVFEVNPQRPGVVIELHPEKP